MSLIDERKKLIEALAAPGREATLGGRPAGTPLANDTGGRAGAVKADDEPLTRFAAAFLDSHDPVSAPYVLHGLVLLAAADRGWADALVGTLAGRLVEDFSTYPPASGLLTRVAATAASSGHWPIARRAYETLFARNPALDGKVSVDFAEALYRTGATAQARARLERSAAGGKEAARALLMLAEINEAAGDRRAALSAYDALLRDHPRAPRSPQSLLAHARLLEELGPAHRARSVLRMVVEQTSGEVAGEAAYRLGQMLHAEGQHASAVEWYLTAAKVAAGSPAERRALVGAIQGLVAMGDRQSAGAIYQRLLQSGATQPEELEAVRKVLHTDRGPEPKEWQEVQGHDPAEPRRSVKSR